MKEASRVPLAVTPKAGLRLSDPSCEMTMEWLQDSPPSGEWTNMSRPLSPTWKSLSRVTTPRCPLCSLSMTGQYPPMVIIM